MALSFKTVMPLTPEKAVNKVDEIADILARLEHVKPIIEVKFSSLGLMQDRNGKERVVLRDWYPDLGKRNTEVNGDLSANPNLSKYVSLLATPTILASVVEKKLGVTRAQKFENDLAEACERLGLKHDPAKERRLALKR